MIELDEPIEDTNIPEEFKEVGQSISCFAQINYETALSATINIKMHPTDLLTQYKGKILDIIRNNPPLASVPEYYRDGREDYLWYSDFYDEITKDVYLQYRKFVKPVQKITPASYAEELAKIDLPYFKELIDLISLERLCMDYEEKEPKPKEIENKEELPNEEQPPLAEQIKPKQILAKCSYNPKLNSKQYALLAECVETIKLFRCKVNVAQLKKLLTGKLTDPLQVTNQKSLVYLLDSLKGNNYIKTAWVSVAEGNQDFISFRTEGNKQRYGDDTHFITMQQLLNNRRRNKREAIHGLDIIDDMIEMLEENKD